MKLPRVGPGLLATFAAISTVNAASDRCAVGAADTGAMVLKGQETTVIAVPKPEKIVVGEQFGMDLMVCSDLAETTISSVHATMPRHGHGMNYKPSLKRESAGRYRAEGLLFHMPGQWRLSVRIDENGDAVQLSTDMTIEP